MVIASRRDAPDPGASSARAGPRSRKGGGEGTPGAEEARAGGTAPVPPPDPAGAPTRPVEVVTAGLKVALCVLNTVVWGLPATFLGLLDRSGESVIWIARRWVAICLAICRVKVEAEGQEHIDPGQPYVFMSNHQSNFDIAATIHTIPVSFRFVAKRELARIPIFGWALVLGGHIVIDRGNTEQAVQSLRRAAEKIRRGVNVIIYPEGTRSPTGRLGPFKSGGFHLALQAGVPIVPISVSGSHRIAPKKSLRIRGGRIKVVYGRPISTEGLGPEDRKLLMERVRRAILAGLDPALQGWTPEEAAEVRAAAEPSTSG